MEQRKERRGPAVKIWLEIKSKQTGFVETFGRAVPSHVTGTTQRIL